MYEKAEQNYTIAFNKYKTLIDSNKDQKYPTQYYRIGKMYENGWGVERNPVIAQDYYYNGKDSFNNLSFYSL